MHVGGYKIVLGINLIVNFGMHQITLTYTFVHFSLISTLYILQPELSIGQVWRVYIIYKFERVNDVII